MSKRIAVLHAQIPFSRGGAELMVESLTRELKIRGYNAELVSIPFRWYPQNDFYNSLLMWRLLNLSEINGEKIDLVIPTKFPTYGIEHDNKVVWLMHQHRAAYDLFMNESHFGLGTIDNGEEIASRVRRFDNISLSESKKIFTISKNVASRLKENNDMDGTPLYHPPALYGRYSCETYGDYVLVVGRLDPLKRVDLLIEAMAKTKSGVKTLIVGEGPEKEKLKQLVNSYRLENRVKFMGRVSDEELLELYANAGCVYYAPVDEDYGYVTLEAFSSRKPVVTCNDSGGVLEFVENGKSGIVCTPNSMEIASAIESLFATESMLEEYGENGYRSVQGISWDNVIERLTQGL